ncbi:MAG: hypothetical protein EBX41_02555 [Chitinophagia bacterium]|nr:hypothetical protein [Chitinophagia bacterium]
MKNELHTTATSSTEEALHGLISRLQAYHYSHAQQAGDSKDLLAVGVKDKFAQVLDSLLANPISAMHNAKKGLDASLSHFVENVISAYLNTKKDLVAKAVLVDSSPNVLYYIIALKNDSLANRIAVNDFFDFYDDSGLSDDYPVYFQYIAERHFQSINYIKEVA